MHRIVPSIPTLAQHLSALNQSLDVYRPPRCPQCGRGVLWRHGCYYRKADRGRPPGPSRNPVPIRRYCCAYCRHTCSRLPLCIAPRRWYDWGVQQAVLICLLCGESLHCTCRSAGMARRTVRRWRDWLFERNDLFAFFLRSRFPEWGRTIDRCAFWKNALESMSLGQVMVWLDRELCVP